MFPLPSPLLSVLSAFLVTLTAKSGLAGELVWPAAEVWGVHGHLQKEAYIWFAMGQSLTHQQVA